MLTQKPGISRLQNRSCRIRGWQLERYFGVSDPVNDSSSTLAPTYEVYGPGKCDQSCSWRQDWNSKVSAGEAISGMTKDGM